MKLLPGQRLTVEFDDHSEDAGELIRFQVHGRLVSRSRTQLVIDSWEYADLRQPYDSNEKRWTIARSAVQSIERLCPTETWVRKTRGKTKKRKGQRKR